MASLSITTSYAFIPLEAEALKVLREKLKKFGSERMMKGLVLIATEGINATVAGSDDAIKEWKAYLREQFGEMLFKDSKASSELFTRWSVKIKTEIVGLKDPNVRPEALSDSSDVPEKKRGYLTPEEWNAMLERDDVVLVDARNSYEIAIGQFPGAIDPGLEAFHEFSDFAKNTEIPKEKNVLMYCTGGIRCEKALPAMVAAGYEHVYQLEGGILGYLERFPEGKFEGECFIFDRRVAVDKYLRPSETYGLCPHCGHAGDRQIICTCGKAQKICRDCQSDETKRTCSKRCRNERRKHEAAMLSDNVRQ